MTTTTSEEAAPSPVALIRRGNTSHADRAVRSGELITVMRGVYAEREAWRRLKPWERYLARVHAAATVYPGALFCRESAAALRGLPVFLEPREVHIAGHAGLATSRVMSRVRIHCAERLPESTEIGGIRATTLAETAVDIARGCHHAIGLAVAGTALRSDARLTRDQLGALNEKRPSSRGRRHARWVIERASGVPESTLEHVSLAVIEWLGFPLPELQRWFLGPDATGDRVDFWWDAWGVAGEADGAVKYSGELGDAREALQRRGTRDARLLERGARATPHWGWSEVIAAKPLRAVLLSSGLPTIADENSLELRSLQRVLSPSTGRL